ncbi:MAG: succinate dehydrogenase, hydrophobic membrane anchor protein [Burkholderiales bacterium]
MRLFSGQRAFVLQRLSALVLLAYLAGGALWLAFGPAPTFSRWQAWSAQPLAAAALLVLAAAVLAHAWVGVRDVMLDYLRPLALRLAALGAVATVLAGLAAWTALILFSHVLAFA